MGTHDCSWQQFCVNTLGSFYCVNHTVLCAEGYILNAHRKCVGKLEPLPAARATAVCSAPRQSTTPCHMLKDPSFACELPHSGLLRSVHTLVSQCLVPLVLSGYVPRYACDSENEWGSSLVCQGQRGQM